MSETPQVAPASPPASNDEAIGQFAKSFLNGLEQDDEPNQNGFDAPEEVPDVEVAAEDQQETEVTEEEATGSETAPQEAEIEVIEVEKDGKKFKIPAELKGDFMAKKDYSEKTAALSQERKQLAELTVSAQQIAMQAQQMAPYHAQLYAMDSRANQLQQALASRELADDPIEYNKTQGELAILFRNRDVLAGQLGQAQSYFQQQFQAMQAQRLAVEAPALFEELPALKEETTRQSLVKYLRDQGADDQVLGYIDFSPIGAKLAYKAQQYDRMVADQAKARTKLAEKVKTAPPVASNSRAPQSGAQDKQLRTEWKKGGGKLHDPAFSALLRSKLRGK